MAVPAWTAATPVEPDIPKPTGWVNDFGNVLSSQWEAQLTEISTGLEKATSAELVYLIMPTIAPFDDFTYGMAVFKAWQIGKKDKDNGLLILLALKERRIRIVNGYGLEGILPDGKLGRYRDQYLVPQLKASQLGKGLAMLGAVIAQDIAKDAGVTLTGAAAKRVPRRNKGFPYSTLIMLGIMITLSVVSRFRRRRGRYVGGTYIPGGYYGSGGGGFGGGFGGFGGGFSGGGGVGGSW
ncbi:TPM domain-containing protein [bacterium]|nr:TPM domain-containing protein [bacterium]